MPTERTELGNAGEEAVCQYLVSAGYRIVDRNWRRPWGELDIVAEHGNTVHFIEVKASRRYAEGFAPTVRANWQKMAKVRRTARTWLATKRYGPETEWQMDVAAVIMGPRGPEVEIFRT